MSSVIAAAQDSEIQLDGIIVTVSKVGESAIDALAGSSVVSKQQLDTEFQADSVSAILDTIPGVTTSETASDTAQSVNLRGLQDFGRVNVLVEGARQNFQRSGHNANGAFYLDPEMIKSVDVTRGPSSTIYGSGAIGGVVAFELIDAEDILRPGEYAAIQSRTRYGTNGDGKLASGTGAVRVGNFDIVGQVNGRWANDYEDGDGNRVSNSGEETDSRFVKARWRKDGHGVTGTIIDYQSQFVDELGAAQRDTEVENQQYTLGYTFSRPDTPLIDFSAKIYRNDTKLDQTRITNSMFEPAGSQRSFDVRTDGFDIFNTSRFEFGSTKLALTYGGDAFRDEVSTNDPVGNGDEFTPSGERTAAGAFVQSHFTFFEIVDLIGALRYDSYEIEGGDVHLEGDRVSPKVTLGVTPLKGVTLFTTYAEGYRAPAVTETLLDGVHPPPAPFPLLPNPNLRPEVAHNLEGGVNLKYDSIFTGNDAFRAKAVVFRNKIDDFIDQVALAGPPPMFFQLQYQNVAEATLEGVEVEATYDARSWFAGVGAHRIRGTNEETGEGLYSAPADQVTITAGFRAFDEKLVAGARARFVSAQDRIPVSTETVFLASEAYTLVDLFAYYDVTNDIAVTLNVDNVLDEDYRQYLDRSDSPGLNARIGLTMRLGAN